MRPAALLCAPLVLAGAAIGDATGGAGATAAGLVRVGGGPSGVATGFVVSPGRVVTVAHLLDGDTVAARGGDGVARGGAVGEARGGDEVQRRSSVGETVTIRGGDGVARRGKVLRRDETLDLALLAVPGLRPAPAFQHAGTRVLLHREGAILAEPTQVLRRINARVRAAGATGVARRPALELAATPSAGDSGAPVLIDGRLAGILFARSRERAGIAYAIDAAVLDRFLR